MQDRMLLSLRGAPSDPRSQKTPTFGVLVCCFIFALISGQITHAQTEQILYSFTGNGGDGDGFSPTGGLVMDSSGNIYGTTVNGGANGVGTVFKLAPSGTVTILHSFGDNGTDGFYPNGGMVMDNHGNLYGTTRNGGPVDQGAVFKVTSAGSECVLYSFGANSGDGAYPQEGLTIDVQGNLYGTTSQGGLSGVGTVFEVSPGGTETILHNFTGTDGSYPGAGSSYGVRGLTIDTKGNLYGATYVGGAYNYGTVFRLTPPATEGETWTETVLYSFNYNGTDGFYPNGGMVLDGQGNLYGTTLLGGALQIPSSSVGGGSIFKLTQAGTETILFSFPNGAAGDTAWYPQPGLVLDEAGNLYGVTGGEIGYSSTGIAFQLAPSGILTVLYDFGYGLYPQGGLLDWAGNLYGATSGGGTNGSGTLFEITPPSANTTTETPTFYPPPGLYNSPQIVTISDSTQESTIYDSNLSIPSTDTLPYSGPISVTSSTILGALATAPGFADSAPVLAEYGISPGAATAPIKWPNPAAITYGMPLSAVQLDATSTVPGTFTYFPAAGSVPPAGTQTLSVTFTPANTAAYASSTSTVQLVVNKAVLTVAPVPPAGGAPYFTLGYGDRFPYSTDLCQISGFVDGDTLAAVSGSPNPTVSWGSLPAPPVGNYTLSCALGTLAAANYTFSLTSAPETIAVVPAVITVKPDGAVMKYGRGSLPAFGYVVAGLKYGQTASVLSAAPGLTTPATAQSGVGSYAIAANVSGITAPNYTVVAGPDATLTITPATLTARAANLGAVYDKPLPALSYTVTGLLNGDTSSVVSGSATLTTTAVQGSPVGNYPITFSTEGLTAANYKIVYDGGTLTVRSH